MATCKGPNCGAEIRWVQTRKGGRIPHWVSYPDRDHFRQGRTLKALAVLSLLLTSCAMNRSELTQWTRHWEDRMGLPEAAVEFVDLPSPYCGWVQPFDRTALVYFGEPVTAGVLVKFDTGLWCGLTVEEHDVALHEACHRRLMHHRIDLSEDPGEDRHLKEAEVEKCSRWYRVGR
jgi:hypothetical protein